MPPTARPFPRFIADAAREGEPYGRWADRLAEAFADACAAYTEEAGAGLDPATIKWFPDRSWGGQTYIPVTGRAAEGAADGGEPGVVEYFGWVSFETPEDDVAAPEGIKARADFTDVTADDNPDWQIDLNDDVLGNWRTDGERGGDVTLIWGLPLVRGAVAASAELDGELLDQAPVSDGRFTLVAVDAIHGFGDDLFVTVRLWDRRVREVAAESLYDEPDEDDDE